MAISVSSLTASGSTTDGASFNTASVSPTANALLAVWVVHSITGGTTATVSGLSLTWSLQKRVNISSSTKVEVWTAPTGGNPGSGVINIATAISVASLVWDIDQATGIDISTPLVTGNQPTNTGTGTNATSVTYTAASSGDNRLLYGCGVAANVTQTPRTNWTELADQSQTGPSVSLATQWRSDATETTGSSTLSGNATWAAIGLELEAASVNATSTTTVAAGNTSTQATTAANTSTHAVAD